jgi:hypothetical protein
VDLIRLQIQVSVTPAQPFLLELPSGSKGFLNVIATNGKEELAYPGSYAWSCQLPPCIKVNGVVGKVFTFDFNNDKSGTLESIKLFVKRSTAAKVAIATGGALAVLVIVGIVLIVRRVKRRNKAKK